MQLILPVAGWRSIRGGGGAVLALCAMVLLQPLPGAAQADATAVPTVVAQVGDTPILDTELERWSQANDASNYRRVVRDVYDARQRALDAVVSERLLTEEAARRGQTVEHLLADELRRRTRPVSNADVDAFIAANPFPAGTTREMVAPLVTALLTHTAEQAAKDELVAALRADPKSRVRIYLESPYVPPRRAAHNPVRGMESAPVEVIVFSDFECPFCRRADPVLMQLADRFPRDVRLVWKQFPLAIHARARPAAEAAQCANEQGKFWEFHDALFADPAALQPEMLESLAARLGLEREAFAQCVRSHRHADEVADDTVAGERAGVVGTPTVFINGVSFVGALPYELYERAVRRELESHP